MQPLLLIGSAAGIGLGAFGARKAARIRPELDAVRVVVSFAVIAVMSYITSVRTPRMLMFGALMGGAVIGMAQGLKFSFENRNGTVYAKRTAMGIAVWGAGLLVSQVAAAMNRAGTFKIGQAISYFSIAMTIGMYFGRQNKMRAGMGRYAASGAASVAVLFVVLAMPLAALANDPPPPPPAGQNPCQIEPDGDVDCNDSPSGPANEPDDYDPPAPQPYVPYQQPSTESSNSSSGGPDVNTGDYTPSRPSQPSGPSRPTGELAPPIKGGLLQSEPIGDNGVTVQPAGAESEGDPVPEEIPPGTADGANGAGTVGALVMGALGAGELLNNKKKTSEVGKAGSGGAFAGATAAASATNEPPKPVASSPTNEPESELAKLKREHEEQQRIAAEEQERRRREQEARDAEEKARKQKELEKLALEKAEADRIAAEKAAADKAAADKAAADAARERAAAQAREEAEMRARAQKAAAEREAAEREREKAIARAEAESKKQIEEARAKRAAEQGEKLGKLETGAKWVGLTADKTIDFLTTATGGPAGPGQRVKDAYLVAKNVLGKGLGDIEGGSMSNPTEWLKGVRDANADVLIGKGFDKLGSVMMGGPPQSFINAHPYANAAIDTAEGMAKDLFFGDRVKNVLKADELGSGKDLANAIFTPVNPIEEKLIKPPFKGK